MPNSIAAGQRAWAAIDWDIGDIWNLLVPPVVFNSFDNRNDGGGTIVVVVAVVIKVDDVDVVVVVVDEICGVIVVPLLVVDDDDVIVAGIGNDDATDITAAFSRVSLNRSTSFCKTPGGNGGGFVESVTK